MGGYKNGKVEIWYGDSPPSNLNILWQKRVVVDNIEYSGLFIYDNNFGTWNSISINDYYLKLKLDSVDSLINTLESKVDTLYKTLNIPDINGSTYNTISGGFIATDGGINLTVDNNTTGYVRLPDGSILQTTLGAIDTTYTGSGGVITYYTPIGSQIDIVAGNLSGEITYDGAEQLNVATSLITKVIANDSIGIDCNGSALLTDVSADSAIVLSCVNCALTADSIAAILRNIVVNSYTGRKVLVNGGTNADHSTWSVQAKSDLETILNDLSGTVSYVGE